MKITKNKDWYKRAWFITSALAWFMCTVPTIIAGFLKLPKIVVTHEAEQTLSGAFIFVIICAAYPIFKGLLKYMKSPSAWLILWILTGFLFLFLQIPKDSLRAVYIVTFTAAIGNSIGAVLFFLAKHFKEKWKFCGEMKLIGG
jgi:fucose 4-O-acetylase-like acetyltransferase